MTIKRLPSRPGALHLKAESMVISEADRQATTVGVLKRYGYTVLQIGQFRRRIRCTQCGGWIWPTGSQGNDVGTPDTFVTHPRWGKNVWRALEFKRPKGARRPEQVDLYEAGHSVFVERTTEAISELWEIERRLDIAPLPALEKEWAQWKEYGL